MLLLVLCLQRQPAHLRLELGDDIAHARQVVERAREPGRRLVAPDLEALHPGRLLEQLAAFFRTEGERRVDGALPDHDELVGAKASLTEELDHVTETRARAVDEVFAITGPVCAASDGHLAELDR